MTKLVFTTSWDDGHKLDLKLVQLLLKYNIKGTFYLSSINNEFNNSLIKKNEIIAISKNFEIGSHTFSHACLDLINNKQTYFELIKSKKYLENITKKKITSFCYPGGRYNKRDFDYLKTAGYKLARTTSQYNFSLSNNSYELGTTIQVNKNSSRLYLEGLKFATSKYPNLLIDLVRKDWLAIAKKCFDYAQKVSGIYHLWGHSWQIEKLNMWRELEKFFQYIKFNNELIYKTNGELIEQHDK